MANTQKYKLVKGSHSRLEDGGRVRKEEGDIFVPTDRELENFPWKFEPVLKKEDGNDNSGRGTGGNNDGNKNGDGENNKGKGSGEENNNTAEDNSGEGDKKPENDENDNNDGKNELDATDITELSTRDAGPVITECEEVEQLKAWLEQEQKVEKPRSTITQALESRINALEEGE